MAGLIRKKGGKAGFANPYCGPSTNGFNFRIMNSSLESWGVTGSPSSKCEHRRASALLRNIQNIRICMGKKLTVSVSYENERISNAVFVL